MSDRFKNRAHAIDGPATHAFAINPSDTADLEEITRALYVGGAGAISLTVASGETVVLAGVPSGTLLPVRVLRVAATGTDASDLVGLV